MEFIAWVIAAFLSGSIPFSILVGKLVGGVDIRDYGDHNPGAMNALRAIGGLSMLAFLLDYLKGAVPVFIALYWSGLPGWQMLLVSLAPIVGHAFSPWLALRGGKSVTTTFGVWTGLTLGTGPILMGLLLVVCFLVTSTSGWAVALMFLSFGGFVICYYHDPLLTSIWTANLILLLWKHRHELTSRPQIRAWATALLGKHK